MTEVFGAAAKAVGHAVGVSVVGFLCGAYPKDAPFLPPALRKGVSRLLVNVLMPVLTLYTIARSVTWEGLLEMWPLFMWCVVNLCVSAGISWCGVKLLGLKGTFGTAFLLAGTFGNNMSLPLLLLETLCKQPVLADAYQTECRSTAYGLVLLYGLPWRIALFGFGVPVMAAAQECTSPSTAPAENGSFTGFCLEESEVELEVLTVAGVKEEEDHCTSEGVGDAPSPVPYQVQEEGAERSLPAYCKACLAGVARRVDSNIAGSFVGLVIGVVPFLKGALVGDAHSDPTVPVLGDTLSSLGEPCVTLAGLLLAAALAPTTAGSAPNICSGFREIAVLTTVRFILVPAVGYPLVLLAFYAGFPGSPLLWLVVLLEFSVPSAQMVVVCLTALGQHGLASNLAPAYAVQYLSCIVALTAWTFVALYIVTHIMHLL